MSLSGGLQPRFLRAFGSVFTVPRRRPWARIHADRLYEARTSITAISAEIDGMTPGNLVISIAFNPLKRGDYNPQRSL